MVRNSLVFQRMHGILYVHDQSQDSDLDFWRIIVPENEVIKTQVVQELHCTPYSAHPRIQRTVARVKRFFLVERNGGGHTPVRGELCNVSGRKV